jgi:hypothetical protein
MGATWANAIQATSVPEPGTFLLTLLGASMVSRFVAGRKDLGVALSGLIARGVIRAGTPTPRAKAI